MHIPIPWSDQTVLIFAFSFQATMIPYQWRSSNMKIATAGLVRFWACVENASFNASRANIFDCSSSSQSALNIVGLLNLIAWKLFSELNLRCVSSSNTFIEKTHPHWWSETLLYSSGQQSAMFCFEIQYHMCNFSSREACGSSLQTSVSIQYTSIMFFSTDQIKKMAWLGTWLMNDTARLSLGDWIWCAQFVLMSHTNVYVLFHSFTPPLIWNTVCFTCWHSQKPHGLQKSWRHHWGHPHWMADWHEEHPVHVSCNAHLRMRTFKHACQTQTHLNQIWYIWYLYNISIYISVPTVELDNWNCLSPSDLICQIVSALIQYPQPRISGIHAGPNLYNWNNNNLNIWRTADFTVWPE